VPAHLSVDHVLREIGRRLRTARAAADLTQAQAADRSGIDLKRWQRIEQGTVNATVQTLVRAANAVGTNFWSLLGATEQKVRRG
jgi:transcriptional regulator with XRE-family HTH domain